MCATAQLLLHLGGPSAVGLLGSGAGTLSCLFVFCVFMLRSNLLKVCFVVLPGVCLVFLFCIGVLCYFGCGCPLWILDRCGGCGGAGRECPKFCMSVCGRKVERCYGKSSMLAILTTQAAFLQWAEIHFPYLKTLKACKWLGFCWPAFCLISSSC